MSNDPMDIDNAEESTPVIDGNAIAKNLLLAVSSDEKSLMGDNLPMKIEDVGMELTDYAGINQKCKEISRLIIFQSLDSLLKKAKEIALGTDTTATKAQVDMLKYLISKAIPNAVEALPSESGGGDGGTVIPTEIIDQIPVNESEKDSET